MGPLFYQYNRLQKGGWEGGELSSDPVKRSSDGYRQLQKPVNVYHKSTSKRAARRERATRSMNYCTIYIACIWYAKHVK